jgi:thiol-disulfide isomerase/thioredoxin
MDGHAARRLGAGRTNLLVRLAVIVLLIVAIVIVVGQLRKLLHPQTTQQGPETLKAGYVIRPFSARDLNGQTVDNSFFAKQRLTMVNVWGTFCGPCIREMPDLAQLPAEFRSSDFAILGVIADTPDADNEITARQLVSTAGATYTNVIPDRSITVEMLADVTVVPTTFFVDHTGTVVGTVLTGSRSKAQWITVIKSVLASLPTTT